MPSPPTNRTPTLAPRAGQNPSIALIALDCSDLVLLAEDDGCGFYVASAHHSVTWSDTAEAFSIATEGGTDTITADELADLRSEVLAAFRRDGEFADHVSSTVRAGLYAECLHGDAPPPCAAQPAATPNPATPAEETHMLRITSETLTDGFAQLTGTHDYLTERGIGVALASVKLTGPQVVLSTHADGWATLDTIGGVWEVIVKTDELATLRTDLGGVEVIFSSSESALLALLPEAGLTVNFGAGAQVAA